MSRFTRPLHLRAVALLIVVLLMIGPGPLTMRHVVHAQTPDAVKIRVEVTDDNFKPDTIEVEQGKLVELTFVWAHQSYPNEEHIMVLEGYKLESDEIDANHRETTLKFVADKPGTFNFKCDSDCELHDYLQRGSLKVTRGGAGGGGAASLTPTILSITPSSRVTAGESITLTAALKDAKDTPVPKAEVRFYLDAAFAGVQNKMPIGKVKTNANGIAYLQYRPTLNAERYIISAHFEGMGIYDESQQSLEIPMVGVPASAYNEAPTGLENIPTVVLLGSGSSNPVLSAWLWSVNNWGPLILTLVVLGVWLSLVYVLYNLRHIGKTPSKEVGLGQVFVGKR